MQTEYLNQKLPYENGSFFGEKHKQHFSSLQVREPVQKNCDVSRRAH
ncbi:MAG: hypothetical protein Q4A04_07125 [Eubacteriales bacterium]|nr:hypothetical protein [Eubacteriales bacterium]